jgi:hypothetical protein
VNLIDGSTCRGLLACSLSGLVRGAALLITGRPQECRLHEARLRSAIHPETLLGSLDTRHSLSM